MSVVHHLEGKRFGRLTVVSVVRRTGTNRVISCRCDCGTEKPIYEANLISGRSTSCGCFRSEKNMALHTRHGEAGNAYHKRKPTPEYKTWQRIKARCFKTDGSDYRCYGARGITVCERWMNSFETFLEDMGRRPSSKHSIDRIDNNGNYEPSNCRWATRQQQNTNTRRNRFVLFDGSRIHITAAAKKLGVHRATAEKMLEASI